MSKYIKLKGSDRKISYSIRSDKRLYVRLNTGIRDYKDDGTPIYRYEHFYASSEMELKKKIQDYFEDAEEKQNKKVLFEFDILEWLKLTFWNQVENTTYDRYEGIIKNQIIPEAKKLSNKRVVDINQNDCKAMLQNIGFSYSDSTLKKARILLKAYFRDKVDEGLIDRNPADFKVRKSKKTKSESYIHTVYDEDEDIIFLSDEEIVKVKNIVKNGYIISCIRKNGRPFTQKLEIPQGEFFIFMLNTGIRTGEACALRYSDIDFEKGLMTIRNNITNSKKRDKDGNALGGYEKREVDPKTDESKGTVKINSTALEILKRMKTTEPEGYDGYILHDIRKSSGNNTDSLLPNALFKRWQTVCKYAKIPARGVHCLRHSFASHLFHLTKGNALFVSQQMRHRDVAFTERVYVNILKKYRDEIFENFEI